MLRTQVAMGDLQSQLEALRQITQELQTENEQKTQTLQVNTSRLRVHSSLIILNKEKL